jgi:hypothetical protein
MRKLNSWKNFLRQIKSIFQDNEINMPDQSAPTVLPESFHQQDKLGGLKNQYKSSATLEEVPDP